jgi:branched-chain amino acid transport system ATP-binding protein
MTGLLEVDELDLYYGDVRALDKVCLSLPKGVISALVGANGAGKTSLLRAIVGISRPRAGRVRFSGREITGLEPHQVCNLGIALVAEGRQLFPNLTVLENLELGALLPRARSQAKRCLEEVFAMFPRLAERRRQLAGSMSGGEQQLLAIGRGLMGKPELILLDEPSLGLAPRAVEEMLQIVGDLQRRGLTILLVEQNVAVSLQMSEVAYVLENGRIVLSGSGAALLGDERVRRAYLGL